MKKILLFALSAVSFSLSGLAAEFTDSENAWLKEHRKIRIGTYDRDAPYAITSKAGVISGIAPEYMALMMERLGVKHEIEWKLYSGRQIALKALKNGEIDLINPYFNSETEALEDGVVISKVVFGSTMAILYCDEFTDKTLSVIASPYTRLGTSYVRENFPDSRIVPCLHAYDCIDHLLAGEAKCVIMYTGALRTAAAKYEEDFNIKPLSSLCDICFAALPENAELVDIVNKGIACISKKDITRLETQYFIGRNTKVSVGEFFNAHPMYVSGITVMILSVLFIVFLLIIRRRAAEHENAAKTMFLFNMSHDIRTPMNAIIGFSDIAKKKLKGKEGVEEIRTCLDKIDSASNLLLQLINSILDMSRIGAGKAKLDEVECDIRESFLNVETTLKELAHSHDIEISFSFGKINNRYVYADFNLVSRVLVNVAGNAIKYTKAGGYVKIKCEQVGLVHEGRANYRYTFEDNGIGMSEEFQKTVFDSFAREHNAFTSRIQGTGLGLALCKSIVELMNGDITCKSKQGVGSVFTVDLPFRVRTANGQNDTKNCPIESSDPAAESNPAPSFVGKHILLVEDNELNREVAVYILQEQGFSVETAADGAVAVRMVREKRADYYDYILMDIQMPIMNGYEATAMIRAEGFTRPIIALSANAFVEDREASFAAGMNDHVAKPIKVKELIAALSRS